MTHHDQNAGASGRPPCATIERFPVQPQNHQDDEGEGDEYLVDIDTHHAILVRATSADEAAAKALTGNPEGSDLDMTTVAHDVHVCVHSGIGDSECDGHDEEAD